MISRRGFLESTAVLVGFGLIAPDPNRRPTATEIIEGFPHLKDRSLTINDGHNHLHSHVDLDISWDTEENMYRRVAKIQRSGGLCYQYEETYHDTFEKAQKIGITFFNA